MPGLVPGIHVFESTIKKSVDGRDKSSHDDEAFYFLYAANTASPSAPAFFTQSAVN
jgi:hypothetical protein